MYKKLEKLNDADTDIDNENRRVWDKMSEKL